jgi:phage baseplate assembly protein W
MAWKQQELEVYIGKGITLPLRLVKGGVPVESGFDLIRSSIKMILAWTFGTRFFLNEFGSRVEELFEEPADLILTELVEHTAEDAINTWEKRVEVVQLSAELDPLEMGKINLTIMYRVKAIDRTDTFIYPFYSQINY